MDINIPFVLAEVEAVFAAYEQALTTNDLEALDRFFFAHPATVRYGGGENLYGIEEIRAFRAARSPAGLERRLKNTLITTYGTDFAVAATLFYRDHAAGKVGRQMQSWARMPDGWKVIAAHVSIIDEPTPA